tara:strand:+ start:571 stop:762 length:192 start_codon:yes stop_codon:yes gene_type:complete
MGSSRSTGKRDMWKKNILLSDVLRMSDLIKEINIQKYTQNEFKDIVNQIVTMTVIARITDDEN